MRNERDTEDDAERRQNGAAVPVAERRSQRPAEEQDECAAEDTLGPCK
jgi:hypothetical protein